MKYKILFLLLLFGAVKSQAQVPQAIPYQAVARDTTGALIANRTVALRFTVYDSAFGGTMVYRETQTKTTNVLALFTANIGMGTALTGTFGSINWGINAKFLQVEIDPMGGTSYINMGTQQLLSVPYALYSGSAGSISGGGTSSTPSTLIYTTNGF